MKFKKSLFILFVLTLFLKTGFVFAAEIPEFESFDLPNFIVYIFNWLVSIASTLSVLVIVLGGLYHLVSLGMGKATSEGKEWVKSGVLGLIFVLSSYLIIWTINPNLIEFRMVSLIPVPVLTLDPSGPSLDELASSAVYNEIPIGTLTETLLARTTYCYDFNPSGDPIDGDLTTPGWEPTFLDHDRVDCIFKLSEAVTKKAKLFSDLSEKIVTLMNTCQCSSEKCNLNCDPATGCDVVGSCPGGSCAGSCVGASCLVVGDCCPQTAIIDGEEVTEIKNKIEHGPILLETCGGNCRQDCQIRCEEEYEALYGAGWYSVYGDICHDDCEAECRPRDKEYEGLDEFRTLLTTISPLVEEEIEINGETVTIIKKDAWENLKILEQLMYLREKLTKMKEDFEADLDNLKDAENQLTSCYSPKPYLELLKIAETTEEDWFTITTRETFTDPVTDANVDASKYCKGYSWNDASIFNTCQKICSPGANLISYEGLGGCDGNIDCIKDNYYKCGTNNFGFTYFQDCLVTLNENCKTSCEEEDTVCQNQIDECKQACDDNSNFLFTYDEDNEPVFEKEDCYVNFQAFGDCSSYYDTFESFRKCVESSMCLYCTDQYAGYPDCLKKSYSSDPYSPWDVYQNPSHQKDYLSTFIARARGEVDYIVPISYPESKKCPLFSKCPQCPCENDECTELEKKRLISSADCMNFAYNDDPLTFYCRSTWTLEIPPTGRGWTCSKADEIPVGQTVDDAEYWAEELIELIEKFTETTESMIEYIKRIGEERDYCKCDSKCSDDEKICTSGCKYSEMLVPVVDPETGGILYYQWSCWCNVDPCAGNPCLKMINLLMGKTTPEGCPENTKFCGIPCYYSESEGEGVNCLNKCEDNEFGLKEKLEEMKEFAIEKRSDVLKELIYSRKKMDEYSALTAEYGSQAKKLLSCRGAYLGTHILKKRCYGTLEGTVRNPSEILLDNWFFCSILAN